MAEGHIVAGRQFRTKTDYEAALRDKKKIDKICSGTGPYRQAYCFILADQPSCRRSFPLLYV